MITRGRLISALVISLMTAFVLFEAWQSKTATDELQMKLAHKVSRLTENQTKHFMRIASIHESSVQGRPVEHEYGIYYGRDTIINCGRENKYESIEIHIYRNTGLLKEYYYNHYRSEARDIQWYFWRFAIGRLADPKKLIAKADEIMKRVRGPYFLYQRATFPRDIEAMSSTAKGAFNTHWPIKHRICYYPIIDGKVCRDNRVQAYVDITVDTGSVVSVSLPSLPVPSKKSIRP